jgi:hypothetical protein
MLSGRRPLWRVTRYSPLGSMALLPWLFSLTTLQRLPGGLVELEALAEPLPLAEPFPLADRGRAAGSRYWAQPQQSCHKGPFGQIEGWMLGSMATCKNRELCTKAN